MHKALATTCNALWCKFPNHPISQNCTKNTWRRVSQQLFNWNLKDLDNDGIDNIFCCFSISRGSREIIQSPPLQLNRWNSNIHGIVQSTIIYSMFRHLYIRQIGYLLWAGSGWGVSMSLNIFKVSRAKVGPRPRAWVSVMANIKSNLRNLFKSLCIRTHEHLDFKQFCLKLTHPILALRSWGLR